MNYWFVVVSVLYWCLGRVRTQCKSNDIYTLHHDLRVRWGNYKDHQVWKLSQFDSCKKHHFCPPWLGNREKFFACGYGFFNENRDSDSPDACLPCPAGKYCLASVLDCEPGYYCPENGLPKEPWPGYYAPNAGMTEPIECPLGTYQPFEQHIEWEWRGIAECIPCDRYKYCDTTRLTKPTGDCEDGWICNVQETSPRPEGNQCPTGKYCKDGTYQPVPGMFECFQCREGMYCSEFQLDNPNGRCDAGWYCDRGESAPRPTGKFCQAGYMCPYGKKTPCGKGYYQPRTGQTTCIPCPVGKYCNSAGLTSPSGNCHAGCCQEIAQIKPSSCPPENPTPCSQGSYEKYGTCVLCPEGMYCAISGLSAPSGPCHPKWFCELGEITPNPLGKYCPAGYECPAGIKLPCGSVEDVYYYQPDRGQTMCKLCPNRYDCTRPALERTLQLCRQGYYCQDGRIQSCAEGSYCNGGKMKTCPNGFEQPIPGQSRCVRCEDGVLCHNGERLPCPEHMTCFNGLAHYCELGYTCTFVNGQNVKTPCPPGTERYELNSTGCVPCRKSRYCRSASSYECFRYHEGFFCEGGADKPFLKTSLPGEYYKLNKAIRAYTRENCGPGTYSPNKHNSECLLCPFGKYCDKYNLAEPVGTCSAGYYCNEGSISQTENLCLVGHICVNGLKSPCPPGFYCSTTGLSSPTGTCPVNTMCPKGSTAPVPCPEGTTQPIEGQSNCI